MKRRTGNEVEYNEISRNKTKRRRRKKVKIMEYGYVEKERWIGILLNVKWL